LRSVGAHVRAPVLMRDRDDVGIDSCYLLDDRISAGDGGHYDYMIAYAEKAVASSVSFEFDCGHVDVTPRKLY